MDVILDLISESLYSIKAPYEMQAEYITIHNTANDASAKSEIAYMKSNNSRTSFHYAVDDKEARQAIPLCRNAWHAGDGNGKGNRASIGIEICYSKSGGERFDKAEKNAARLTAELLNNYKWDITRVKRHKDWSGKDCPHMTMVKGWDRFLDMVQKELDFLQPKKGDFCEMTDLQKQLFVTNVLYIGLLNREPDAEGAAYWISQLKDDNIVSICNKFMNAEETRGRIIDVAYERVLHRHPDDEGRAFWLKWLGNGKTADDLYKQLKNSAEAKGE